MNPRSRYCGRIHGSGDIGRGRDELEHSEAKKYKTKQRIKQSLTTSHEVFILDSVAPYL